MLGVGKWNSGQDRPEATRSGTATPDPSFLPAASSRDSSHSRHPYPAASFGGTLWSSKDVAGRRSSCRLAGLQHYVAYRAADPTRSFDLCTPIPDVLVGGTP